MTTITRSINFPDELMSKLQAFADQKYITVSAVVIMACAEFIDKAIKNHSLEQQQK